LSRRFRTTLTGDDAIADVLFGMPEAAAGWCRKHATRQFIDRPETGIAPNTSGTDKTHVALGQAASRKGRKVRRTTAAALVHEMIEAVDARRLTRLQKGLAANDLLIVDEATGSSARNA
jgi:DNA replication protein DnaC